MNDKKCFPWRLGFALAAGCCLLAGCISKDVVEWSPNGQTAALLSESGLYLCDTNGTLSGLLVKDVMAAAWFPDSERLAVAQAVKYSTWAELAPLLPPERRSQIEGEAEKALAAVKAGASVKEAATLVPSKDSDAVALRVKQIPGARETLGTNWAEVEKAEVYWTTLRIASVAGGKTSLGAPFIGVGGLDGIGEIRVSPDGGSIAYVWAEKDAKNVCLSVISADGGARGLVDDGVAIRPDWTADSRALVYIKAVGVVTNDDQLQLGSLTRRAVTKGSNGFQLEKPEELVATIFNNEAKARCLADGRILFSAAEVRLPSTAADMPKRQQLFSYRPGDPSAVAVIPADKLSRVPQDTSSFEVDPSGSRVSLVESKLVAVMELKTGALIFPTLPTGSDSTGTPVWRTPDELCYVTSQEAGPSQVSLWRAGKARVISQNWPAEARKGILDN